MEGLLPHEIDHLDDTVHYTTSFKIFYERLNALGEFTSELLSKCAEEDEQHQIDNPFFNFQSTFVAEAHYVSTFKTLFEAWREYYIVHIETMKEIRNETLTQQIDPNTLKPRKLKMTVGHSVFTEISRLFFLIHRPRLLIAQFEEEMISLKNTQHPMWISIVNSFDISDQYEKKEDKDVDVETRLIRMRAMWQKPVLHYTQVEVMDMIFFLTQTLNMVPKDCIEEFRSVFEETWIRASILMQEAHPASVLDAESMRIPIQTDALFIANRLFGTFVALYMGEIMRRFFYYDMLLKKPMQYVPAPTPELVKQVTDWIVGFVNGFADEAFIDMYVENCPFAYNFPHDDEWFKYAHFTEVHSRAACLAKFRPHLYRKFFSEERITKRLLMESVNQTYAARTFMFKAITNYIQIVTNNCEIKWDNGVVIHSHEIHMSAYVLQTNKCPIILQVFSSYWCYDEGSVYMTDNVFEALAMWFYLFHTKYDDTLYGHHLGALVAEVLETPPPPLVQGRQTTVLL